ncbi:MAG: O-antigen ligase family protein [Patescibacteria group bacterium]|nr:O-antigen ligase family protein [Patescibacteria group bacterium]
MELIFLKNKKTYLYVFFLLLIFLLSFIGFIYPWINYTVFWSILILTVFLSFKKLKYGVFLALFELFIGSKGYLFSFPIFDYVVSLRLLIFIVLIAAYLIYLIRKKEIKFLQSNLWFPYLLLIIFIGMGFLIGLKNNNPSLVFYDINAYFYLALIFPFFSVLSQKENIKKLLKILGISVIALSLFTLFILADFSIFHYNNNLIEATKIESKQLEEMENLANQPENARLAQATKLAREKLNLTSEELNEDKPLVYRWLKDLGLAEVSYLGGRFFRIFSTSHFYLIIYFLIIVGSIFFSQKKFKNLLPEYILGIFLLLIILISFSRSFWLGLSIAFVYLLFSLSKKKIATIILVIILMILLSGLILNSVSPKTFQVVCNRFASLLKPNTELAASNRINMLNPLWQKIKENPFFGSGFGTLITFKSLIPGTELTEYISVYLYEWAYLDIIVKIGLLGFLAYLYFISFIYKTGHYTLKYLKNNDYILIKSLLAGLISLLVIHLTTPYLNHPLGIGYILIIASVFYYYLGQSYADKKGKY